MESELLRDPAQGAAMRVPLKGANNASSYPQYRRDIDGMRAIAVLSVVGFHAFPVQIKGGFTGVDIFFVISGFLISTIIFTDLKNERFSFLVFFGRRVRRIFPALSLVLLVCYAFGWFALFADEFGRLGKHVAAGAGFVSNIVLWTESGYFDAAADHKPLLHLWSLGIEEQFYIIWPLLLWLAWKARLRPPAIILFVLAISFAANVMIVASNPVAAFYSPLTRFWELLFGSSLAWFALHRPTYVAAWASGASADIGDNGSMTPKVDVRTTQSDILSVAGIALIIAALLGASPTAPFPGWWALLPTLGAVMIIAAGPTGWVNRSLLSHPLAVWFGLISYPLYLWHWPLLYFVRTMSIGPATPAARIAAVIVAILLAALTYKFIEQPIRHGRHTKAVSSALAVLMVLIGGLGYYTFQQGGLGHRYTASPNDLLVRQWHLAGPGVTDCSRLLKGTPNSFCATTSQPTIALIGDSHAGALFHGMINNTVDPYYRRALIMGAGSCQPTLAVDAAPDCGKQLAVAMRKLGQDKGINTVILAGYYGFLKGLSPEAEQAFLAGYDRTVTELVKLDKRVVIVIDNPAFKQSAEFCQPRTLPLRSIVGEYPTFCSTPTANELENQEQYRAFIGRLRERHPNLLFFDAKASLCHNGRCPMFMNDQLLYGDNNHLSIYGSRIVANDLVKFIANADRALARD